jgi:hypothetical protein
MDGEGESGVVAAAKPWARQSGSGRGLNTVGMGSTVVQTVRLTGGPHTVSYFPELSKPYQTWKLKMYTLPCSKNS